MFGVPMPGGLQRPPGFFPLPAWPAVATFRILSPLKTPPDFRPAMVFRSAEPGRRRWGGPVWGRRFALAVVLLIHGLGAVADEELDLEDIAFPSLQSLFWSGSLTLRSGGGYRDNPQLSVIDPRGSALVTGGGELVLMRLPVDGREFSFFGSVDQTAYLEEGIAPETVAVVQGRFLRHWDDGWSVGGSLEYYFLKQVFDASEVQGVRTIVPAIGHTLTARPMVGRSAGAHWRVELEVEGTREWLADPLDSHWDLAPRLSLIRRLAGEGELRLGYAFRHRQFDTRPRRDEEGSVLTGELAYDQHGLDATWRRHWGAEEAWRSTLRTGWLRSLDNGGGYFDYDRVHFAAGLRYRVGRWAFLGDAAVRWYGYPAQPAGDEGSESRRRWDVNLVARAEWTVVAGVRWYAEYQWESSDENMPVADYRVTTFSMGLSMER